MQLPSRTINSETKILVRRSLPVPGEILVQRGQRVEALQVVGRAEVPRRYRLLDVARQLGLPEVAMDQVMLKAEGDTVKAREVIARAKGGLPFFQRSVRAPAEGRITAVGPGWVLLETEATVVEVQAFINGVVSWVAEGQAVGIEGSGAMVEAACGLGGEAYGPLKRLIESPFEPLTAEAIDDSARATILLGGCWADEAALRRAEEVQVRGVIVGSMDAQLLKLEPPLQVRVVATEGFGHLSMAPSTFGLIRALGGKDISIRGSTPSLSVANDPLHEPAVVLATTTRVTSLAVSIGQEKPPLRPGSRVRVTYGPLLGNIGTVALLPDPPQTIEAGLTVPGAIVKFEESASFIPWSNLEQIV